MAATLYVGNDNDVYLQGYRVAATGVAVTDALATFTVYDLGGYDADGDLTSQTDPLGNVTGYGYDALGRETSVTAPSPNGEGSGLTTTYAYDLVGNLLSQTDPLGHTTSYTYLCPCQLAGADFLRSVDRRGSQGTGRFNFAHSSMAA